jgi:HPt (histidine-containing phosphotransfer) domain-containing protein
MTDAAPGEGSPAEVLDPQVVDEMFNLPGRTGPSLLREIVALFLRAEPPRLAALAALADERRGPELAHHAHQLAGSCAVLGARQLQAAAGALERAALAGDWTAVAGGLAAARQAWSRLEGELARRQLP